MKLNNSLTLGAKYPSYKSAPRKTMTMTTWIFTHLAKNETAAEGTGGGDRGLDIGLDDVPPLKGTWLGSKVYVAVGFSGWAYPGQWCCSFW